MEIKLEIADHVKLQDLHRFIYEQAPDLIIDEHYETMPGIHSEPIITALLVRFTSSPLLVSLQKILSDYFSYQKEKEKEITQRELNKQKHQENILKISLKRDSKWEQIDPDKFDRLKLD